MDISEGWVTIISIVTSATIAIAVALINSITSVINNRNNNREQVLLNRFEKTFDKQVEAYREIVEWIGKIRYHCSKKEITKEHIDQLRNLHKELFDCFQRQRVFLPDNIEKNLASYLSLIFRFTTQMSNGAIRDISSSRRAVNNKDIDDYNKYYKNLRELEGSIVLEMHKLLGVKESPIDRHEGIENDKQ